MKSIKVSKGSYDLVIFIAHIIAISNSEVEDQTYIRVTNGNVILVDGSLSEIEEKISKA